MNENLVPNSSGSIRTYTDDNAMRQVAPASADFDFEPFLKTGEASNAISVCGQPVEDVVNLIKNSPKEKSSSTSRGGLFEPAVDLFDAIDRIVIAYLENKHFESFKSSDLYYKYFGFLRISSAPLTEEDFSLFRVLGRGGFGLVNGCKKCTSGKLFAMKVMDKRRIKMKKSETLCVNERNILSMVNSPFIVCLKYAFSTKIELFLILDLMTGGDLGYHLHRCGRFAVDHARFYFLLFG